MDLNVNSSSNAASTSGANAWQKTQQDFKSLATALKSNDLDAAKTAYASLTKDLPAKATSDADSPLAKLGQALQSGDLASAQQAMSGMKGAQHHGGHHGGHGGGHHGGGSESSSSAAATPSPPSDTTGNLLNVVA